MIKLAKYNVSVNSASVWYRTCPIVFGMISGEAMVVGFF
jgi:hypothetical protein